MWYKWSNKLSVNKGIVDRKTVACLTTRPVIDHAHKAEIRETYRECKNNRNDLMGSITNLPVCLPQWNHQTMWSSMGLQIFPLSRLTTQKPLLNEYLVYKRTQKENEIGDIASPNSGTNLSVKAQVEVLKNYILISSTSRERVVCEWTR